MSKQNRPQYLVSSDSIGFMGSPEQLVELWKEYFDNKTLDGVEVIAFKPMSNLKKLLKTLKNNNMTVLSFHGKTGGEYQLDILPRIIMTVVNFGIADAENILKIFPETDFLSHGPYLSTKKVQQNILFQKPKKIWIENHLSGKHGVEDAIKQIIFYRGKNIDADGMLDIYHYLADSEEKILTSWPTLVGEIRSYIFLKDKNGKQLFKGVHFPIGTRLGDSLPIDEMTDEMLELFSREIIPHVTRVVFENQQKNLGLLFSTNKMIESQKVRNKRIIERFKKTGIIL